MSNLLAFRPNNIGGDYVFRPNNLPEGGAAIQVICAIENGGMNQGSVTIDDPYAQSPVIFVSSRPAIGYLTGGRWRHAVIAVENAQGKTPVFRFDRASRDGGPINQQLWRPVMTTDRQTWIQSGSVTYNGGTSGTFDFSFPNPLPAGRIYIASNQYGTQGDADDFAQWLLTEHSGVVSPSASSDGNGVYAISPAETDDIGRSIGGNNLYGLLLSWGGSTTDGLRKRKLVITAGIHAAGEQQSWLTFIAAIKWMLESSSSEAANFRANWNVWLYFNLNPGGIRGGNSRGAFRSNTDPNRTWHLPTSTFPEIVTTRSTIKFDLNDQADAAFNWHGDVLSQKRFNFFLRSIEYYPESRSTPMQAFIDQGTTIFGETPNLQLTSSDNTDMWFAETDLNPVINLNPECPAMGWSDSLTFEQVGQNWIRTLTVVDQLGFILSSGPSETKGIIIPLYAGSTPVGAQSNVQVAFFDQPQPKDFSAPTFTTGSASINSSGLLTVNLSGTSLNIGQPGFAIVYKLDAGDHENSPVFAGRVTVTDVS